MKDEIEGNLTFKQKRKEKERKALSRHKKVKELSLSLFLRFLRWSLFYSKPRNVINLLPKPNFYSTWKLSFGFA
ncbi:MAG: hypothetical protein ACTS5F_01815 [Candidatus Hodgkinia cicadicola]